MYFDSDYVTCYTDRIKFEFNEKSLLTKYDSEQSGNDVL